MTPTDLLTDLRRRGVRLAAHGDRLTVDAPAGTLTDADRAALAAAKSELLVLLAGCPRCRDLEARAVEVLGELRPYLAPPLRLLPDSRLLLLVELALATSYEKRIRSIPA